ncbi:(4Fe-4S)-binding protein [Deinococcus maricopensis]|uniref:Iron-binding zinc finger CDGSH type domain-containing protein n=1 Tax=Deinococcus maricopensis (strain DSM 21211 / LMG 22137 / NRRL B-23946 / LB-34) TaxID=709986 RepID=E8UBU0_DEIML|nr:(4Fe-4S)-binding protein [Deinococcus maricopensis]ADV68529.1 protein of unknown function DUF1271 [Deinococcus maricopensis DSM 21211]
MSDQASTPPGKAYPAPGITVYFDGQRCIHAARCVAALPLVFDPARRPWIRADLAGAAELAEVVRSCPSGALQYAADAPGVPAEVPDAITTVTPFPDGALVVRGDLRIMTALGEVRDTRATLCRCGQSGNKPFCDGTHAKVGWRSDS